MAKYKLIVDVATGKQDYIELNEEELAELETQAQLHAQQKAEREAEEQRIANLKASAKAKLTAGEPLTEEEAAVLVI
jgi:hypothetical protein